MIFQRAVLREFATLAAAVFMTLFAIALTTQLIRLLGRAAGGSIPTDAVVAFLGFFALGALPVLLSLTMFISVLLTLTRSWGDSEMVIWFSSGLSLAAWLRPVTIFALPQIAVIAALSLFISPWAAQMASQYTSRLDARDDVSRVTPGVFGETAGRERVFFVESVSGEAKEVRNVFLSSVHQGQGGVSMSRVGRTETAPNGDRFIVLEHGRRYQGTPGTADYRVVEFERLGRRIQPNEVRALPTSTKALPTVALVAASDRVDRAELFWRISVPISAVVLTLLAIPLARVNPRMGRSFNFFAAMFLYMLYSNCLNIVQSLIAQGRLDFWAGLALPHVIALAVVVVLFRHQLSIAGLFARAPRAAAPETA